MRTWTIGEAKINPVPVTAVEGMKASAENTGECRGTKVVVCICAFWHTFNEEMDINGRVRECVFVLCFSFVR